MPRPTSSRARYTLLVVASIAASFAGGLVGGQLFAPGAAYAQSGSNERPVRPPAPHVVNVPIDGEYFVGPSKHTLLVLREEGNGATLEFYDAAGQRVVVSDLDARLRGVEARLRAVESGNEHEQVEGVTRDFATR